MTQTNGQTQNKVIEARSLTRSFGATRALGCQTARLRAMGMSRQQRVGS